MDHHSLQYEIAQCLYVCCQMFWLLVGIWDLSVYHVYSHMVPGFHTEGRNSYMYSVTVDLVLV